jgi:hypothetical protein
MSMAILALPATTEATNTPPASLAEAIPVVAEVIQGAADIAKERRGLATGPAQRSGPFSMQRHPIGHADGILQIDAGVALRLR